jgi:hypothetical protein
VFEEWRDLVTKLTRHTDWPSEYRLLSYNHNEREIIAMWGRSVLYSKDRINTAIDLATKNGLEYERKYSIQHVIGIPYHIRPSKMNVIPTTIVGLKTAHIYTC